MFQGLDIAAPQPMADRIAEALRQAIVTGRLRAGVRINESAIATTYRISRSPIREALRMLQQEGLVTMQPRRGAFVTLLTSQDVLEVYGVKAMIEGYATRLATGRMSDGDLETLAGYVRRMEEEATRPESGPYIESTRLFHDFIVTASGNRTLASIYHGLDRKIHWLRTVSLSRPGRIPVSLADHRAILDAMRRRDADLAERLARAHIEQAGSELVPFLERLLREPSSRSRRGRPRPARGQRDGGR